MFKTVQRTPFLAWLADPFQPTKEHAEPAYRFTADARYWMMPLLAGGAGLILSAVGWALDAPQFYLSYLIAWTFCLSLAVGALFFLVIQHLTKARWSVVVRRIAEVLAWGFPLLLLLSIPIFIGLHDLYHWSHEDVVAHDPILAGKAVYLNVPFFVARVVGYLVVWSFIAYRLYSGSLREDVMGDPEIKLQHRKTSAWALPVMAVTASFASYDLLMSLDPHFFSTIFGVYFFGGAYWVVHAFIAFTAILLQKSGQQLRGIVTKEHYQDLGKYMFGFTVFWTYIAFSQYMLIWYSNLPEETVWFRHRLEHGWQVHSALLLILHFIVPFFVLLPRATKRSTGLMAVMAVYFFVVHWFDLHWLASPALRPEQAGIHWLDLTCFVGLFGLFAGVFIYRLSRHSLVPRQDAYLPASLRFQNT